MSKELVRRRRQRELATGRKGQRSLGECGNWSAQPAERDIEPIGEDICTSGEGGSWNTQPGEKINIDHSSEVRGHSEFSDGGGAEFASENLHEEIRSLGLPTARWNLSTSLQAVAWIYTHGVNEDIYEFVREEGYSDQSDDDGVKGCTV